MSAIISYAHAAGASPVSNDSSEQQVEQDLSELSIKESVNGSSERSLSAVGVQQQTQQVESSAESTPVTSATSQFEKKEKSSSSNESESPSPEESTKDEVVSSKKAKLAPAPLPSTSAWGASPSILPPVDNPIAEAIIMSESSSDTSSNLIKAAPGKEKWVPFKASVVLASNKKEASKNGAAKKKNKKKTSVNGESRPESKDGKKGGKRQNSQQKSEQKPESKDLSFDSKNDQHKAEQAKQELDVTANGKPEGQSEESEESEQSEQKSEQSSEEPSESQPTQLQEQHLQQQQLPQQLQSQSSQQHPQQLHNNQRLHNQHQQAHQQGKKVSHNSQHHMQHMTQKPYVKHQNQAQPNGTYQPRAFRPHNNNNQNQARRYSNPNGKINGGMQYVPYNNRQFYIPNQYQNQNQSVTNNRHHHHNNHHHNNRNSYQAPYIMQQPQYYTSIPYMGYPQANAQFAPIPISSVQSPSFTSQDKKQRETMLATLAVQIDYYFSTQNMVKDIFLRKHMNDDGFLPLKVIAGFYRVSGLSFGDINLVIESLPLCVNLDYGYIEAEDGSKEYKVRAKDYTQWILPAEQRLESAVGSKSPVVQEKPEVDGGEQGEQEEEKEEDVVEEPEQAAEEKEDI